MASNLVSDGLIDRLQPSAVEHYAEVTGWQRVNGVPNNIALFHKPSNMPGGRTLEILIPRNRSFADFDERLAEAVETLGSLEYLTPVEMLNNVIVPSDAMRFRNASPGTASGLIPLIEGVDFYSGIKRTFSAAACDFFDPQSYHARLYRRESEEYLAGCRLGQTQVGSYIATVLCPINPPLRGLGTSTNSLFPEIPETEFYRSVTARVMQSLEAIQVKLDRGDTQLLIRPEGKDVKISGNFFEALTQMRPDPNASDLEVSVSWSHTISFTPDVPTKITILESYFPELEVVAASLRPDYQPEERQLVGKVLALYGDQNEENLMEGEIILRFFDEERLNDVRVQLEPKDYELACDAHKLGKYVEIIGRLERRGRRYEMFKYQIFAVLPDYSSGTKINREYVKKAQERAKRRRASRT